MKLHLLILLLFVVSLSQDPPLPKIISDTTIEYIHSFQASHPDTEIIVYTRSFQRGSKVIFRIYSGPPFTTSELSPNYYSEIEGVPIVGFMDVPGIEISPQDSIAARTEFLKFEDDRVYSIKTNYPEWVVVLEKQQSTKAPLIIKDAWYRPIEELIHIN